MNIWTEVIKLHGKTLHTLDQKKPFDIVEVTAQAVTIKPESSGIERRIKRKDIQDAFDKVMTDGTVSSTDMITHYESRNLAYLAAILAQLPRVKVDLKPIRLRYDSRNDD